MYIHIASSHTVNYVLLAAVFASCFYVLFKFRLVREANQGSPIVNPLKAIDLKIYDANYFIQFFKKKSLC
jgi:hypothetical protein